MQRNDIKSVLVLFLFSFNVKSLDTGVHEFNSIQILRIVGLKINNKLKLPFLTSEFLFLQFNSS